MFAQTSRLANEHVQQLLRDIRDIEFLRIAVIVAAAWLLTATARRGLPLMAARAPSRVRLWLLSAVPVVRLIVLVVAITLVVPLIVQPGWQNLVAILGAAGVAVGFALKDYVSSLIAGIVAVYERPFRPGDWVEVDGAYGEVRSVGLRSSRLVTLDDTVVTVPNLKLWTSNIRNANYGRRDLLCIADFYVHPRHDAAVVRRKLHDVALTSPYLQIERPTAVVVSEKPWGTHYRIKAYPIDGRDQVQFTSDLTVRGKAVLARLGVEPANVPAVFSDPT